MRNCIFFQNIEAVKAAGEEGSLRLLTSVEQEGTSLSRGHVPAPSFPRAAGCRSPWGLGCRRSSLKNQLEDPESIAQPLPRMMQAELFPCRQSPRWRDICLHLPPKASAILSLCFLPANKQTNQPTKSLCSSGNFLTVIRCPRAASDGA